MKIYDCHCHIESGIENYNIPVAGKNIIFNSIHSYQRFHSKLSPEDAIALVFDYREHLDFVKHELVNNRIHSLKIHSRLQKIGRKDYPFLIEQLEQLKPSIPIIVDAFYYGNDLKYQPSLKYIQRIAKHFSDVPVVVAHAGGYETLKYFYHLKSFENIYFDLSFSLAYLKHTSVFADFKNLIQFGDENKIMFGTDFPFMDAKEQLDILQEIFGAVPIAERKQEKILYTNASGIFKTIHA